jgi:hypothetical protein
MTEGAAVTGQRAFAGFEALRAYVEASDPRYIQDRLAGLLCDLRHYLDRISGARFDQVLDLAREDYERQDSDRTSTARETAVARAAEAHEHYAPGSHRDGMPSPGKPPDPRQHSIAHGLSLEETATRLSASLITDLWHYADEHGVEFAEVLVAGGRAYTEQRLQEEGPFQAGFDTRLVVSLTPAEDAPPFQPVATRQGVVVSASDAEWLLVRTAARLREVEHRGHGALALPADISDRRALSEALGDECGLAAPEILRRLEPWITERVEAIVRGMADAAEMGREHGLTGVEPYCRLDEDGHDTRLMNAFGEIEPTTDANAMHRLALIRSYTAAYGRARKDAGIAPAELAERNFPQEPSDGLRCADDSGAVEQARVTPRAQSRHPRTRP